MVRRPVDASRSLTPRGGTYDHRRMRVLIPLLTPLRALHAETAGNRQQEIGLSKPILQHTATPSNKCRRIVAPKGAGSSPVGHP